MIMNCGILAIFFALMGGSSCLPTRNGTLEPIFSRLQNISSYNKHLMPPHSENEPVDVGINMLIRNIDLDVSQRKLVVDMTFRMRWRDSRLAYDEDTKYITFYDFNQIWTPDPFFKSSVDTRMLKTIYPEAFVRFNSTGDVLMSSRMYVASDCQVSQRDTEKWCSIKVASYGMSTDHLRMHSIIDQPLVMVKDKVQKSGFDATDYTVQSCDSSTAVGEFGCVQLNILMVK